MRSAEATRRHYLIERELADRLRNADRGERARLYSEVYDELFRRVPDHSQLNRELSEQRLWVAAEKQRLERVVGPGDTFLEIGAGDCALSIAMVERAGKVIALDVSEEIIPRSELPPKVEVVISDGCSIPLPPASVDVAFSNQLMEHLHPDDAREQLDNIAEVLRPGGRYVCITPHRFSGPHDISREFDDVATGFHLREYTIGELTQLMREAGFSKIQMRLSLKTAAVLVPTAPAHAIEAVLARMPPARRRTLARSGLRRLLGITVVATR